MAKTMIWEKKTNCLCSNCGRSFDFSQTVNVEMNLYGMMKVQKACPYCGGFGFTRSDHRFYLDGKEYNRLKPIMKEKEKKE